MKNGEQHVDDVRVWDANKRVVGIDPGKLDLIYCSSGEEKNEWFRYTQVQRNFESRKKSTEESAHKWPKSVFNVKR